MAKIIEDLKIPESNESVRLLNVRMAKYITDGRFEEERIPLVGSDRYIVYKFPKWAHEQVEVVLRVGRIMHTGLTGALAAELQAAEGARIKQQMEADIARVLNSPPQPDPEAEDGISSRSAPQSDPAPASPLN